MLGTLLNVDTCTIHTTRGIYARLCILAPPGKPYQQRYYCEITSKSPTNPLWRYISSMEKLWLLGHTIHYGSLRRPTEPSLPFTPHATTTSPLTHVDEALGTQLCTQTTHDEISNLTLLQTHTPNTPLLHHPQHQKYLLFRLILPHPFPLKICFMFAFETLTSSTKVQHSTPSPTPHVPTVIITPNSNHTKSP